MNRPDNAFGFSLVELLVSIAIIGILASLCLAGSSVGLRSARATKCKAHLHQLGIAVRLYASDYRGRMPLPDKLPRIGISAPEACNGWYTFLEFYLGRSTNVARCPEDRHSRSHRETSYAWDGRASGMLIDGVEFGGDQLRTGRRLFRDWQPWHTRKTRHEIYADGSIRVRPDE